MAVETLAVVTYLLDNVVGPAIVQSKHLTELTLGADEALDDGIAAFRLLIDILRRQSKLFGVDGREQGPFDDIKPVIVAVPHRGSERLLGNDLRKDHVIGL